MEMPDTFNSWFLVTELHVWMLMVKAMEIGGDGRLIRNYIVEAMWEDVSTKGKKLGVSWSSSLFTMSKWLNPYLLSLLIKLCNGFIVNLHIWGLKILWYSTVPQTFHFIVICLIFYVLLIKPKTVGSQFMFWGSNSEPLVSSQRC